MAYINVPEGIPGIRSLAIFRPETAQHLYQLAQTLLRGPSPLTEAEREIIATYVSHRNNCKFCMNSHAAAARHLLGADEQLMDDVLHDYTSAAISDKMKTLLNIAGKVQILGKEVKQPDIDAARNAGANDLDIHDTVLIAATFSMFNRYVDGLATLTPENRDEYTAMGQRLAEHGYASPKPVSA
jgi:uncharacterized peroxidase-related enzyme